MSQILYAWTVTLENQLNGKEVEVIVVGERYSKMMDWLSRQFDLELWEVRRVESDRHYGAFKDGIVSFSLYDQPLRERNK